MTEHTHKVIVVGGGITGLSAAYYLQKQAIEQGLEIEITLIEVAHRLGGNIQTLHKDGFVIERGPDSFVSRKNSIQQLAKELEIEDRLVQSAPGKTYVAVENNLYPIPVGSVMGVPTNFGSFLTSGISSWFGKARALGDFVLPASTTVEDQPLGKFLRRRFGNELVENLIEPLFSGVFAGDIDRLSLTATFPELLKTEQQHRSLIRGLKKNRISDYRAFNTEKKGMFQTFEGGLETLVRTLEVELENCTILKGVKVEKLERQNDQAKLRLNNGATITADGVIFALPHVKLLPIFEPLGLLRGLKEMPSTSIATVSIAFPEGAVKPVQDCMGFVVARNSDFTITACSAAHLKWPSLTPPGKTMYRSFIGRVGDEAVVELSDQEIVKAVLEDLHKLLDIQANPEFTVVSRMKEAMPQYIVGHVERVALAKKELLEALPMVQIAGGSFEGFGLPACVDQGKAAANQLIERFTAEPFSMEGNSQ
ncbi:protoporphyrinogen oxidase [Planococcus antarcticus DSM 14505]|uniref:Coproporphyrinogen III oxidase n=1 Tax=Planococcus antarcticus DSM 14505 TaxID=1185653 RepID=A0AA87II68_9BACL|nr:protoporphyrinogen oxidase [Planococcus antarcticus]EIM05465.1 protoporphyrinogen oxidase [Planococcus antarcticus DSM 14505]